MSNEPREIRRMFAGVAPRYDFLNHALSGGVDVLWRKRTVARGMAGRNGQPLRVLDVCTGTGDLALAFARRGCDAVGADFCPEMLALGARKRRPEAAGRVGFVGADAVALPFAGGSFDLATVAFGIRNVQDPVRALRELARVVKPGGKVLVLEFAKPRTPVLGRLYLWYFRRVLPRLGALLAPASRASGAYAYLPRSVMQFPERDAFLALMRDAGLLHPACRLLSFGIAALYEGDAPAGAEREPAHG